MGDQVVQNFLLQFGPDSVSKHENALDLVLGMEKSVPGSASDAAA